MDDELLPFSLKASDGGGIKMLPLAIRHGALDRSSLICIAPRDERLCEKKRWHGNVRPERRKS